MKKTKKKMSKTEKQQQSKGITLVSLVVTIIVLIILAGISINLVLGDKGIITVAKKAKENMELAKIEEETQLNELYTQLEDDDETLSYEPIEKLIEAESMDVHPKLVIKNPTKNFYDFKVEDFEIEGYDYNRDIKLGKIPVAI